MAMFGNGTKTVSEITQVVALRTLLVLNLARATCGVAAVGGTPPGFVGRRTVAGRRYEATKPAFV